MAGRMVKRAYKYRFYPTVEQADLLNRTFGCARYVYNRALAEKTRAWTQEQRRVTFAEMSAMLPVWKSEDDAPWLADVPSVALQQSVQHLQRAFDRFFRKQAKYPRFKSKKRSKDSATFTRPTFRIRNEQLTLAKMREPLNVVWHRPLPQDVAPSTVTASRDSAGRWFVSILVEDVIEDAVETDSAVGVDAGLSSLVTLSTGEKIVNPRHERQDHDRVRRAQRNLSRKQKGSANREKARRRLARVHARIADRRRDHLHKLSTTLIRENQVVCIEDLTVRNMVRNRSLARAISDASWSAFRGMLTYKAAWYGRDLVIIDRFFPSSKMCSSCGAIAGSMSLSVREWICGQCSTRHDRDVNAAKNIRAAGLAAHAYGDGVRPSRAKREKATVSEVGTLATSGSRCFPDG